MNQITHEEQQKRWDEEHAKPSVLPQMDSTKPSSGIKRVYDWLVDQGKHPSELKGLEVCCGKGRSVIWLAQQDIDMIGLDFSPAAIKEAEKRANKAGITDKASFKVHDVTKKFPIKAASLDFVCDCFGSTDIESIEGREAARDNIMEVLKPGGYLGVYLLSSDDEFQKEMAEQSPGPDSGSFIHPVNGKYEKAFTEQEVKDFYKDLKLVVFDRVGKTDTFFGKEYKANHIWAIFQKPA